MPAQNGPFLATIEPVVRVELERIEALELLAMTLAHLSDAETRGEVSPRVPLLMAIRDSAITIIVVEHNMSLVMGIADRVAVLDAGRLVAIGTPAEIRRDRRVIEAYVGLEG